MDKTCIRGYLKSMGSLSNDKEDGGENVPVKKVNSRCFKAVSPNKCTEKGVARVKFCFANLPPINHLCVLLQYPVKYLRSALLHARRNWDIVHWLCYSQHHRLNTILKEKKSTILNKFRGKRQLLNCNKAIGLGRNNCNRYQNHLIYAALTNGYLLKSTHLKL